MQRLHVKKNSKIKPIKDVNTQVKDTDHQKFRARHSLNKIMLRKTKFRKVFTENKNNLNELWKTLK